MNKHGFLIFLKIVIDGITVVLDNRNLRTPSKNIVKFPLKQRELALLTAAEWDAQTKNLKAHYITFGKKKKQQFFFCIKKCQHFVFN